MHVSRTQARIRGFQARNMHVDLSSMKYLVPCRSPPNNGRMIITSSTRPQLGIDLAVGKHAMGGLDGPCLCHSHWLVSTHYELHKHLDGDVDMFRRLSVSVYQELRSLQRFSVGLGDLTRLITSLTQ